MRLFLLLLTGLLLFTSARSDSSPALDEIGKLIRLRDYGEATATTRAAGRS